MENEKPFNFFEAAKEVAELQNEMMAGASVPSWSDVEKQEFMQKFYKEWPWTPCAYCGRRSEKSILESEARRLKREELRKSENDTAIRDTNQTQ